MSHLASPTWCTWVCVNSGSWWWTGRPDMLWFMGSQRVGHDWVTELKSPFLYIYLVLSNCLVFSALSARERGSGNTPTEASRILIFSHETLITEVWVVLKVQCMGHCMTVLAHGWPVGGAKAHVCRVPLTRVYLGVLLAGHRAQTCRCHVRAADGLDLFNATELRLG